MALIEKFYNVNNIIKFKIINNLGFLDKYFDNLVIQYKNFESTNIDNFDFTVYIGRFTPSNERCYILDDNYYIKNNYFYCKNDMYKTAKWSFEIKNFESGNMEARISSNVFGRFFISGFLIDFLIHYKMTEKGYPFIHASGVSKGNSAFLFVGRSGSGKTSIALNFVERGFYYLGDNFIILHKGHALSFLSPLNIFTYNLSPIIRKNIKNKNLILKIKSLVYKLTLGYVKIFTKINVHDIFPDSIIKQSKIKSIFLILPKKELNIKKIEKNELIDHIVMNQKLEFQYFINYLLEYSYMFPDSKFSENHWKKYREMLKNNLNDDISIYRVEVPQSYDQSIFDEIAKLVENERNT